MVEKPRDDDAREDDVLRTPAQLAAYLEAGCKPASEWRIGTEHEKFGFHWDTLCPLEYGGPHGIEALLRALQYKFEWEPVTETGNVIGLKRDGCAITLEPGGQLELSGEPLEDVHRTCAEVNRHLTQVKTVADPLNVGFVGIGFQPKWRRDRIPWMPKGRYRIMGDYMRRVGNLGHDMMTRTCTVQVNLDFSSEADMVRKFRVGLALQPVATALFANSPFLEGRPNGYLSYRAQVWTDTDPGRTGQLPFVFESGMGFERYVEYMLDVPMYFVSREGRFIDAAGQSFRDFLAGRLPALLGERPTIRDWEDHLTTAFPEVRMKRFLEMRGADGGPWRRICALPALWVGLLYNASSLEGAWELVQDWSATERSNLLHDVNRHGFRARIRGMTVGELAGRVLEISRAGLAARNRVDDAGRSEEVHLEPLHKLVEQGKTAAEVMLEAYETRWRQNVDPVFSEYAY